MLNLLHSTGLSSVLVCLFIWITFIQVQVGTYAVHAVHSPEVSREPVIRHGEKKASSMSLTCHCWFSSSTLVASRWTPPWSSLCGSSSQQPHLPEFSLHMVLSNEKGL